MTLVLRKSVAGYSAGTNIQNVVGLVVETSNLVLLRPRPSVVPAKNRRARRADNLKAILNGLFTDVTTGKVQV